MPDFATWALADALTVRQAACLWAGADPSESRFYPTGVLKDQITAVEQMLTAAIRSGVLDADWSANAFASLGDHSKSVVTREALRAFAENKNQRPAFLFDTLLPPRLEHDEDIPVADTETFGSTRSRVGRPRKQIKWAIQALHELYPNGVPEGAKLETLTAAVNEHLNDNSVSRETVRRAANQIAVCPKT